MTTPLVRSVLCSAALAVSCIAPAIASSARDVAPVAHAQPFDFAYKIEGLGSPRPTLAFSDGQDTYIEVSGLRESWKAVGISYFWQGPYLVVPGQPQAITLQYQLAKEVKAVGRKKKPVAAPSVTFSVERERPLIPAKLAKPAPSIAAVPAPLASPAEQAAPKQAIAPVATAAIAPALPMKEVSLPPRCVPQRTVSAYVVNFANGAAKLSPLGEQDLAKAIAKPGKIVGLEVLVGAAATQKLRSDRGDYLLSFGKRITTGSGPSEVVLENVAGGDALIRATTEKVADCRTGDPIIVDQAGYHVSADDISAERLVRLVAQKMGRSLRIEGEPRPMLISMKAEEDSGVRVLELIGQKLGDGADIVLRPEEVVLRYRAKEEMKK